MANVLRLREFDTITYNEKFKNEEQFAYLEKKYFDELELFVKEYSSDANNADIIELKEISGLQYQLIVMWE